MAVAMAQPAGGSEAQENRAVANPRHVSSLLEDVFRMCPRGPVLGNATPDRRPEKAILPAIVPAPACL
ncbi:hypothetical protein PUN4_430130 [Paraburkholderia unamae]|nr:hypothetical protein PUN4_430130 [Paraburkholderia unamae]